MKTTVLATASAALLMLALAGCANNEPAHLSSVPITDPSNRTYTGQQLQQTGRVNPGDALQTLDASVDVRHQ
jgi:hypothetical protein